MSQHPQPPVQSDFDLPAALPAWPKVVGIISIVLASLGLTCGTCGVGMLAFLPQILKMAEQQMGPAPTVMFPGPMLVGITALGVLWSVVLMVAGIMTVKRKPAGRIAHLLYAPVSVLLTIVSTAVNWQYQSGVSAWAAANPTDKWAQQHNSTGSFVGMAIGVIIGLGWPIFLLIWFGVVKTRPEQMGVVEERAA